MHQKRRLRALAACLVATALAAAACSDDGDRDGDETDDGTDTSTAGGGSAPPSTGDSDDGLDGDGLTLGLIRAPVGLFDLLGSAQAGALVLAAEDVAAGGGVLGGPLRIIEDIPSATRDVTAVFSDLVDDGASLLVGPSSSDEARALLPLLADAGAVLCGASTTAPGLATAPEAEGRFVRTALDDNVTALHTFQRLRDRTANVLDRPPQVTIVARQDSYGTSVSGALAGLLDLAGIVATVVPYGPEDVQLAGVADAVVATAPDEVVLVSLEEGPRLASLLVSAGLPADVLLGLDGQATPRFAEQGSPGSPETLDGVSVIGTTGPLPFMARLLDVPESRAQVLYGAQAYDCAISYALAAEATGSTDPDDILAALPDVTGGGGTTCTTYADCAALLRAGEDIDYEGPSGPIDLDEDGEPGGGRFLTANVLDGAMRVVIDLRFDLSEYRAQAAPRLVSFIAAVQTALAELGYYTGPIDGQLSEEFQAALAAFQSDNGLEPTGQIDAATLETIQARLDAGSAALNASIAEVQKLLTELGYFTGPIDGRVSPALADAIRAFQTDLGIEPTGILDAATLRAIYQAGIQAGTPVEPPPEPPPTTTTVPATTTTTVPAATTTTVPAPTTTAPADLSIREVVEATPELSVLAGLLNAPGLDPELVAALDDPARAVTLLAPTNEAIPDAATIDPDELSELLLYHLLDGAYDTNVLAGRDDPEFPTLLVDGDDVAVVERSIEDGVIVLNGTGRVVEPFDLASTAGFVHTIDTVLTPP